MCIDKLVDNIIIECYYALAKTFLKIFPIDSVFPRNWPFKEYIKNFRDAKLQEEYASSHPDAEEGEIRHFIDEQLQTMNNTIEQLEKE